MSTQVELEVLNAAGKKVSTQSVSEGFVVKPHASLLHQVVRWQRARGRSGTHTVKTRAEARGGGIKPWKQKGTGRARAGSNTSPLWVGGGIAHGPKMRSYDFSINKKERKRALASAISQRKLEGRLKVVEAFGLNEISTKLAQSVLANIGIAQGKKVLVVCSPEDKTSILSLRNIPGVGLVSPDSLNVYDILNCEYLLITADVLMAVDSRLAA